MDLLFVAAQVPFLTIGLGSAVAILAGAFALGIRHGIDWDHIAAITDITSSAATAGEVSGWLVREPGVQLTDETHHAIARETLPGPRALQPAFAGGAAMAVPVTAVPRWFRAAQHHRRPLYLGTLYALGHGTMVVLLGLAAILFSEILPDWIDPIMERIVGVTLVFLAGYLFYALYRYFRAGGEFRIRSRWMLIFAGVRNAVGSIRARIHGHEHEAPAHATDQYGARTAYGIGLIHGIGAETGTQVLIIGTAVGAGSRGMSVATLFAFVAGLLISNSVVTILSTAGFASAGRRNAIYVGAGLLAAVFSLVVGLIFLLQSTDLLPDLDRYFHWIGGPA